MWSKIYRYRSFVNVFHGNLTLLYVCVTERRKGDRTKHSNVIMETRGGMKSSSHQYENPLGYKIEDVRPNGGIEKFRSAAYCHVCLSLSS